MELVDKVCQIIKFLLLTSDFYLQYFVYKYYNRKRQRCEEDINGKCVVITGGSSGIGKESAKEFARRGATVVIGDVDIENGRKSVEEIQRDTGNMNVVSFFFINSVSLI